MRYLDDYAVDRQNGRLTESTSFAYCGGESVEGVKSCTLIKAQQQKIPLNESKTELHLKKASPFSSMISSFSRASDKHRGEEARNFNIDGFYCFLVLVASYERRREFGFYVPTKTTSESKRF